MWPCQRSCPPCSAWTLRSPWRRATAEGSQGPDPRWAPAPRAPRDGGGPQPPAATEWANSSLPAGGPHEWAAAPPVPTDQYQGRLSFLALPLGEQTSCCIARPSAPKLGRMDRKPSHAWTVPRCGKLSRAPLTWQWQRGACCSVKPLFEAISCRHCRLWLLHGVTWFGLLLKGGRNATVVHYTDAD
jgi:hypothetical protein